MSIIHTACSHQTLWAQRTFEQVILPPPLSLHVCASMNAYLCLSVCGVCVHARTHTCIHVEVRGQSLTSFLRYPALLFFETQ